MTVTLLPLASGRLSLEFDAADTAVVADAIRFRFGVPAVEEHATATTYSFGGCRFTFQNEWDDPCLISSSPAGDRILRDLHAMLGNAERQR